MEEIRAIYFGERMRFDSDVVIADGALIDDGDDDRNAVFKDRFALKGPDDNEELERDLTYRFYGYWKDYRHPRTQKVEKQFWFKTFVRDRPFGRPGVVAYLRRAGEGNGIGSMRAAKLWDKFQSDAVRILREEPEVAAAAVTGLSVEQCQEASAWLQREQALESCTIELIDLLEGRGFPKQTAKRAVQEWGNRAADVIRRDPYRLMAFKGCGFKRCDAMYLDRGLPPGRLKRQALCAWYSIASDNDGHTWFPIDKAVKGIHGSVSGARIDAPKAMMLAKRGKALSILRTDGPQGPIVDKGGFVWVAEHAAAKSEEKIATHVTAALREHCRWSFDDADLPAELTDHQRMALIRCLRAPIAILGGSPGTGKTFTAAALIRRLLEENSAASIAVAAPTGKAAVRIGEALDEYNLPISARTIHSLLGVRNAGEGQGWAFEHCESNPLSYQIIIVDESSMIDTSLMCSLLAARAKGTHILFVGDTNQLPPVGHGAPLRDFIAAGIPYGKLTEIKRSSGRIVRACAQMRDGERFEVSERIDIESGENLCMLDVNGESNQIDKTLQTIEVAKRQGFDPVWDCQVIVAVNAKSKLSRKDVNKRLQSELNSNPPIKGSPFRVGDKIVNTKNGFCPALDADESSDELQTNEKGDVYVANGELAEVIAAEPKKTIAKLNSPHRKIVIPRSNGEGDNQEKEESASTGCSWELGFAISCHKSQGSEWPIVIVLIDEYPGARMVCSREWMYTAISRAKKLCVLVGKHQTANRFCRSVKLSKRKTFLRELIEKGMQVAAADIAQEMRAELVTD